MTSSWVKGIIAMETHLPLFLYDLIQHAFKNMKAILLQTCIPARRQMHLWKESCHSSAGRLDIPK